LNFLKKGHFVTYVHEFQLYNVLAKELKGQWIVLPWKKKIVLFSLFVSQGDAWLVAHLFVDSLICYLCLNVINVTVFNVAKCSQM